LSRGLLLLSWGLLLLSRGLLLMSRGLLLLSRGLLLTRNPLLTELLLACLACSFTTASPPKRSRSWLDTAQVHELLRVLDMTTVTQIATTLERQEITGAALLYVTENQIQETCYDCRS